MKRSDFLKRLGIGLGAVVVAPQVLASMPAKEDGYTTPIGTDGPTTHGEHLIAIMDYKLKPYSLTIEQVMDIYRQTGMLMYQA